MNILIIGTTDILGGAAKVSWEIKSFLESNGHDVNMFVADKRSDDPKVKVIPRSFARKLASLILAKEGLEDTDWIINTEEFKNADVIHCHNLHGRFFSLNTLQKMSALKPVVWTLHDEWAITPHCAYTLQGTKMENGLYTCPSLDTQPRILWNNTKKLCEYKNEVYSNSKITIVTPSKWLEKRVRNTTLSNQDVRVIPNGIDTSIFNQFSDSPTRKKVMFEARTRLSLPQDKKLVLFLANDARKNTWKGWPYAETVINKINRNKKDISCVCVGDHLSGENSNDFIINRGYIKDPQKIKDYYLACDTLLFTSLAENFPLVILEAMACGLPIVSFDVGGVSEVVKHMENGYISRYTDIDDLKSGLEWVLSRGEKEIDWMSSINARKIKDEFDKMTMCDKYMYLYKEILRIS